MQFIHSQIKQRRNNMKTALAIVGGIVIVALALAGLTSVGLHLWEGYSHQPIHVTLANSSRVTQVAPARQNSQGTTPSSVQKSPTTWDPDFTYAVGGTFPDYKHGDYRELAKWAEVYDLLQQRGMADNDVVVLAHSDEAREALVNPGDTGKVNIAVGDIPKLNDGKAGMITSVYNDHMPSLPLWDPCP